MNASPAIPEGLPDANASPDANSGRDAPRMQKIIIAIHGIGSQLRSDTVRSVASQFGARYEPALPVMPLGYFDIAGVGKVDVRQLDLPESDIDKSSEGQRLRELYSSLGFGEVYWADIPRKVVKDEDKLEESKAWGLSIVSRAHAAYMHSVKERKLEPADFSLAASVVDEIVETVAVMQNLLAVADKAGLFKFDLAPVLRDYVGDVQLVADFKYQREVIVFRFHRVMQEIVSLVSERCRCDPEVYIVAHSEGTVISFLGILEALSRASTIDPDGEVEPVKTDWIRCLRGFMTIGSPIDKHILLWPKLWEGMPIGCDSKDGTVVLTRNGDGPPITLPQPIKWRNYYDFGDPVGFSLDTARAYLKQNQCAAFQFDKKTHDLGFSRYWLPGKAHTDYWTDKDVFGHFINDVVLGEPAAIPQPKPFRGIVSTAIPYLLSFVLHLAAVFVLYKSLAPAPKPGGGPQAPGFEYLTRSVFALSCLLMSATCAARLPRLVKAKGKWRTAAWLRWRLVALGIFALGAVICWIVLPRDVAQFLAEPFTNLVGWIVPSSDDDGKWAFVAAGFGIAVSGWLAPRTPRLGRRLLVLIGTAIVGAIVVVRMLGAPDQALWPVVMAGALFLYAWWLAILVFDLAFVWHRYIRNSVALDTLRAWRENNKDAVPNPLIARRASTEKESPPPKPGG